ncbi:dipeptidase [Rhodospirillum sp. A1_3_36]|uniref:dipeptidase n=1 Tax=Rhodospirillum sp. A1_3_36 TaxID=3391666 RepID=UPI0039A50920
MTRPAPPAWDAHVCIPLDEGGDPAVLGAHWRAGFRFASINVGMDMASTAEVMAVLTRFHRRLVALSDRFLLAETLSDLSTAEATDRLAVAFDLEGAGPLEGNPALVHRFSALGVRQMNLIYNRQNAVGGGCHDDYDPGLSPHGKEIIREMESAGVVLDLSHAGERTSMDMLGWTERPVVFSHANVRRFYDHPRNLTDTQIDACAAVGGVIGVTAHGLLIGRSDDPAQTVFEHLDYLVSRVGSSNVGLGLDYCYDTGLDSLPVSIDLEYWWPSIWGYSDPSLVPSPPDLFGALLRLMRAHGYEAKDIAAIAGGNFRRIAEAVWPGSRGGPDPGAVLHRGQLGSS